MTRMACPRVGTTGGNWTVTVNDGGKISNAYAAEKIQTLPPLPRSVGLSSSPLPRRPAAICMSDASTPHIVSRLCQFAGADSFQRHECLTLLADDRDPGCRAPPACTSHRARCHRFAARKLPTDTMHAFPGLYDTRIRGTLRVMTHDKEPPEVQIARDVLRQMLKGNSPEPALDRGRKGQELSGPTTERGHSAHLQRGSRRASRGEPGHRPTISGRSL